MKRYALLLLCLALWMVGCKTRTVYVPVESKTETQDSIIIRDTVEIKERFTSRDSTTTKDSTVTVVDTQGNVIRTERYRETDRFREVEKDYRELQARYEALLSAKNKEIQVPYPVEKPLTRWERFKMDVGGYAISLSVVAGIIGLSYCVRWLTRRKR